MREVAINNSDYTSKGLTSRLSWSAIIAGTFAAIVIGSMFNLLGIGIGLSAFSFDSSTATTLGIGSIIWLLISAVIYSLVGGWIAGRFSKVGTRAEGMLSGFIAWSLSTLFTLYFAGVVLSGTAQVIGNSMAVAAKTLAAGSSQAATMIMQPQDMQNKGITQFKQQATQLFSQVSGINQNNQSNAFQALTSPQNRAQLQQAITTLASNKSDDQQRENAKQNLVNLLVQNTNMDRPQAQQTVNNWETHIQQLVEQADQAKQAAAETAEAAANVVGSAALITFFTLLLGAICAVLGGWLGIRKQQTVV